MARSKRSDPAPVDDGDRVLSLGEWVCLTLVHAGATHGWAIVKELEPDAALGSVWSLTRQLTYRAVEQLTRKELICRAGEEPGRGPGKVLLGITPAGRRAASCWLDTPVAHVRDVRAEGLLKLLLRERLGLDNTPFIKAQQQTLQPVIDRLLGPGHATNDLADILRRENARAAQRFLATILSAGQPVSPAAGRTVIGLSADNELAGTVLSVVHGDLMSSVGLSLGGDRTVVAVITRAAAEQLGLAPGDPAVAVINATDVMLAKGPEV